MIVFLVGMTGCGKSTLGRELAEMMSFDFVGGLLKIKEFSRLLPQKEDEKE